MLPTTEFNADLRQERCEAVTNVFDDSITHQTPAVRAWVQMFIVWQLITSI